METKTPVTADHSTRRIKDRLHFSKPVAIVFALIFALIGGYIIWRSFAATTLTPTPTQTAGFFYDSDPSSAWDHPGALVVCGRSNCGDQAFKNVSAGGGTVLVYLETMANNSYGKYHTLLDQQWYPNATDPNRITCGAAVPAWPGAGNWGTYGPLHDIRVGSVFQAKLKCVLEIMVADNPHMGGFFADDLGSANGADVTGVDHQQFYDAAVAMSKTFRQVADEHGLIFLPNGTWDANESGGYPNRSITGNALADGAVVEHHSTGELAFWTPYLKSTQWAAQSTVTHGTPFHIIITQPADFTGWKNANPPNGFNGFIANQALYDGAGAPWGAFHANGLPSHVGGTVTPPNPTPPTPVTPPPTSTSVCTQTADSTIYPEIEAEAASCSAGASIVTDSLANGGKTLRLSAADQYAEYVFKAPAAGQYEAQARVVGSTDAMYSIRLSDQPGTTVYQLNSNQSAPVKSYGVATTSGVTLSAGQVVKVRLTLQSGANIDVDDLDLQALKSTPPSDTTAPTVTITAPANNSTVSGTAVTLSATATDNVGVAGVQFKVDNSLALTEDTTAPYTSTWDSNFLANGTHTLVAIARDAAGNTTTSSTVTITISNAITPPTITQSIQANQTLSGTVTWTATPSSAVSQVVFAMDNNTNNTTDTTSPYSRTLDTTTLTNGTHTLGLTVTLTDGSIVWQPYQVGTVTVNNPVNPPPDTTAPTATLTAPVANATVSGATVALTATATDNVAVSGVQFQLNGNSLGTEDTTSPYATTWNTTTLGNGTYTLTAVARDAAGNTKTSTGVTVTVNNVTTPPPDTTAPSVPSNLTSSGKTTTSISLSWGASTDTGGSGLAGYKVYKNGTFLASTTQLTYTDTGLTANTAYSYKLAAYDNAANTSAQTTALSVTTNTTTTPPPTTNPSADFNADGTVNIIDFSIFLAHYNTNYTTCDLNKDGNVNVVDFSLFLSKWGTSG